MMTYFGVAGWYYPDWEGIVYPEKKEKGFDQLKFLASYVDVIEINNTFYRIPVKKNSESWVRRVKDKPNFKFTAKLWQGFTHDESLLQGGEVSEFKRGIEPLVEGDKLGAILVQFPWSFKNNPESRKRLDKIVDAFSAFPLVCEFRHESWLKGDALGYLMEKEVGFCNIDQPVFKGSIKPTPIATSHVGYVRLHGRNKEAWFDEKAGRDERYNYLYTTDELKPWVERIKEINSKAQDTFIITNNHYRGKALANTLELKFLLEGSSISVPSGLLEHYPQLKDFTGR